MDISYFLEHVEQWAKLDDAIKAVILVGSHARGEAGPESDVDLVIITTNPQSYIQSSFINEFGRVIKFEKEDWGRVTSIRAW